MSTAPLAQPRVARSYHGHAHDAPIDELRLDYDARFLRRKMLITVSGAQVLVDLPQTTSLDHNGVLILEGGGEILVTAAPEALLDVRGPALHRLAWHIGNRHTPCQIEDDRLLIQRDHVIRDMLTLLGAELREVTEPFVPEGGAYGMGRTHSHAHGHSHTHEHGHDHAQNHGHGHSHDHEQAGTGHDSGN
ncbi:urease accessory protein UreE [Aliishimia ponticola]|uniref:Urease accessory protein UreE n=1 Tax=Aliishimia ponticola TaxID=2499833 RepID=A0A4S4N9K6_9RHOB|nr:urease accessory protein UreE [Aliishimia ponticola]THH35932.1 urease accessory protein UreE [Aliishimia ponticola]